jgi:hypothetical protein
MATWSSIKMGRHASNARGSMARMMTIGLFSLLVVVSVVCAQQKETAKAPDQSDAKAKQGNSFRVFAAQ